jgi:hypothetical protein
MTRFSGRSSDSRSHPSDTMVKEVYDLESLTDADYRDPKFGRQGHCQPSSTVEREERDRSCCGYCA